MSRDFEHTQCAAEEGAWTPDPPPPRDHNWIGWLVSALGVLAAAAGTVLLVVPK